MASTVNGKKLSMKILYDKERKKVVFAEAEKEVIDFLFYLLSLPLATATLLISKSKMDMNGCLNNLFVSLEKLDNKYIESVQKKDFILKPDPSFAVQAPLLISDTVSHPNSMNVYKCSNPSHNLYYSLNSTVQCMTCYTKMNCLHGKLVREQDQGGGFVKDLAKYMVMDDLVIKPTSLVSDICELKTFNIKDVNNLEEIVVDLGIDEGLKILKACLEGKEAITSAFIHKLELKEVEKEED